MLLLDGALQLEQERTCQALAMQEELLKMKRVLRALDFICAHDVREVKDLFSRKLAAHYLYKE